MYFGPTIAGSGCLAWLRDSGEQAVPGWQKIKFTIALT
jgi:hypothetical protein